MTLAILTCDEVRAAEREAVKAGISLWALMRRRGRRAPTCCTPNFPKAASSCWLAPATMAATPSWRRSACAISDALSGSTIWRRRASARPKAPKPRATGPAAAPAAGGHAPHAGRHRARRPVRRRPLASAGGRSGIRGRAGECIGRESRRHRRAVRRQRRYGRRSWSGHPRRRHCHLLLPRSRRMSSQPAASLCGEVVAARDRLREVRRGCRRRPAQSRTRRRSGLTACAGRKPSSHKHQRGRLAVVSGGVGQHRRRAPRRPGGPPRRSGARHAAVSAQRARGCRCLRDCRDDRQLRRAWRPAGTLRESHRRRHRPCRRRHTHHARQCRGARQGRPRARARC